MPLFPSGVRRAPRYTLQIFQQVQNTYGWFLGRRQVFRDSWVSNRPLENPSGSCTRSFYSGNWRNTSTPRARLNVRPLPRRGNRHGDCEPHPKLFPRKGEPRVGTYSQACAGRDPWNASPSGEPASRPKPVIVCQKAAHKSSITIYPPPCFLTWVEVYLCAARCLPPSWPTP